VSGQPAVDVAIAHAKASFLNACALDVAVRKPGNVSVHSAGHRMQAGMFLDSARAAAGPLFMRGARVGARIEAAVEATWAAAGCNTNLGILLLCAPVAVAVERAPGATDEVSLRHAIAAVLDDLDVDDAACAYRAIARANPGGLGSAEAEDVHDVPTVGLRQAMSLAAGHDLIARQYRDGYADLFDRALPALWPFVHRTQAAGEAPAPATVAAVQRLYLALLAAFPDSHIVRKHGEAVAQSVMASAQAWRERSQAGAALDAAPEFAAWDESLKSRGINPGTTADFTVATLLVAGVTRPASARAAR
jgi:triphosphoribosyl-dephospho-CoA synthase